MGPGEVIAQRYRLERLLGTGGMGAVWAAKHVVTGKPVALKVLKTRDDDEAARRRLLREARAACAVQHPSVVPVHDVVEADDGAPVLVMDLLEGESLRARLDRERTLPTAETLRIAEIVLSALDAAHAAGIVHRDLKPDNLFLLPDGQVRLLDFGVAKLVASDGPAAGSGTLTATGAMVGTPFYMAPEQAFGEAVDGRADLWSVGVLVYECLAGEPPTHGENLGQVLRRLTTGDLAPLLTRAPDVPPAIAAAVDAMLSIDAGDRPPTARAALALLCSTEPTQRAALASLPPRAALASVPSVPPQALPVISMPAPELPKARRVAGLPAIAIAGLAIVGIAGVAAATMAVRKPQHAAPDPEPATVPAVTVSSVASAQPPASASAPAPASTPMAKPATSAVRPPVRPTPAPTASASSPTAPRLLTDVPF